MHPASRDCIAVVSREDKIFLTGLDWYRPGNPPGPEQKQYYCRLIRFLHQKNSRHYRHQQHLQQMRI
ncbi:hypothetical protein ABIE11_002589 [Lelliottia sp. 489]